MVTLAPQIQYGKMQFSKSFHSIFKTADVIFSEEKKT